MSPRQAKHVLSRYIKYFPRPTTIHTAHLIYKTQHLVITHFEQRIHAHSTQTTYTTHTTHSHYTATPHISNTSHTPRSHILHTPPLHTLKTWTQHTHYTYTNSILHLSVEIPEFRCSCTKLIAPSSYDFLIDHEQKSFYWEAKETPNLHRPSGTILLQILCNFFLWQCWPTTIKLLGLLT